MLMESSAASLDSFLVGYDGTERSEPAVIAALELAPSFRAVVDIVHAVPAPTPLWGGVDVAGRDTAAAESLSEVWKHMREPVRALLKRCGATERPVEDVLRVMSGSAAKVLLEQEK